MEVHGHSRDDIEEKESIIPSLEDCVYTSCYCEENVWMLCDRVKNTRPEQLANCHAVFISNKEKAIPLWCQRASKDKLTGLVLWDYHVIFVAKTECGFRVYDLDTTLPFPCEFQRYAKNTLRSDSSLKPEYQRMFRVITAAQYLQSFASDRSHMRNGNCEWLKPPPSYPCIQTQSVTNNLTDFISMDASVGVGEVSTFDQFLDRFRSERERVET